MALAVNLYNEAGCQTSEVSKIRTERYLASELIASDRPAAETRPNEPLDLCHVVPELASTGDLGRVHSNSINACSNHGNLGC